MKLPHNPDALFMTQTVAPAPKVPLLDPKVAEIVAKAVEIRRNPDAKYSPADFAQQLSDKLAATDSFPNLDEWAEMSMWADWPMVRVSTRPEATIKYCGYAPPITWLGGACFPANLVEPEPVSEIKRLYLTALTTALAGRSTPTQISQAIAPLGEHAQPYVERLEQIAGAEMFPLLPESDDVARIESGKFDPRWWPNHDA